MALDPEIADAYLEPVKARLVVARKLPEKKCYAFHYQKESTTIDLASGEIQWKETSILGHDEKKQFIFNNKNKGIAIEDGRVAYPLSENPNKMWVTRFD